MWIDRQLVRFVTALLLLGSTVLGAAADDDVHVDVSDAAMVVSESQLASRIGRDVLVDGGNAVDAAVATAFALAVTWPEAGNIGGGGFMMVRPADGEDPVCVEYRETAPRAMHADSYTPADGTYSQKAVGVPGTVAGLATAHARFGRLPWKRLVMPAVSLATDGFAVDEHLAGSINRIFAKPGVADDPKYAELRHVYGHPDRRPWQPGDRIKLPDLARTLNQISEHGPKAFYTGPLAQLLVDEMRRGDGVISLEDLAGYTANVRPVLRGTFRGYTILGAPPPSSGGTCVIEALNILENFDLASRDRFDAQNVHLIAEACRRAFADRARYLGDPSFTEIPAKLLSKEYAKQLAQTIDLDRATPSERVAPEINLAAESPDTTHFSVIDADGMAVSNTYTLEASWGSRIVVRGAGYLLNNEMGDFNWFPGETNRSGRIGTEANTVAPGKRMLSSQSPSLVEKDGQLVLITGSPGGRTIINTTLGIILNVTAFGMDTASAVSARRMHHQWFPDRLYLEYRDEPPHRDIVDKLQLRGHSVGSRSGQGSAHSIGIDLGQSLLQDREVPRQSLLQDRVVPRQSLLQDREEPRQSLLQDRVISSRRIIGVSDHRRGGRPAGLATDSIAVWDFGEPAGTQLPATRSSGTFGANWSRGIAQSATDGNDHFRIRRDAPRMPLDAYVSLANVAPRSPSVEIKIGSMRFAGESAQEQLRIGFTHDTGKPQVTARMIVGRVGKGRIAVRGEALGGGTAIAPVVIARSDHLDRPFVLRLRLDVDRDEYDIAMRWAADAQFDSLGRGRVAQDREPRFLRLSALNDFSAEGEYVDVDRIELGR